MFNKIILIPFLFLTIFISAQEQKSPSDFLGYELGSYFSRHHQVVDYFNHLDKNSPHLELKVYGKTNEGRILQHAYISSPENLKNLETIRLNHLKNTGIVAGDKNDDKAIVWLSYNIHGNESSSTEAAMKTAFALITKYKDWLKDVVVIIDPCLNPDGRDRYVNLFNQIKSTPYDPSPYSREHIENWQNGRTNHYIFDLNRDWVWGTQIETQQRIKVYNRWLPHIHVDYHEQGINSPYFFPPTVEPNHEIITDFQKSFQTTLAENHAKYFDAEGWFYYTGQSFDMMYPSYGDSFSTFSGAIGLTYEQAGHGYAGLGVYNGEAKEVTLKDRIAHHFTTGISTVEMAVKNKSDLNNAYQKYYVNNALKYKSFVMEGPADALQALQDLLETHQIKAEKASPKTTVKGFDYQLQKNTSKRIGNTAIVVNTLQPKGKLAHVLLEPKTQLSDSLTNDITAWSLPYAYGLKAIASETPVPSQPLTATNTITALPKSTYGYVMPWSGFKDAQFLAQLIQADIRVRFNNLPLKKNKKNWKRGSLFILMADNQHHDDLHKQLADLGQRYQRKISSLKNGLSEKGPDLGSNKLKLISPPKVAVLYDEDASPNNYGEIWHFFEQELQYPLIQIPASRLSTKTLEKLDVLLLPSGWYSSIMNQGNSEIMNWVRGGGNIIAFSGALNALSANKSFELNKKEKKQDTEKKNKVLTRDEKQRDYVTRTVRGGIYEVSLDKSHPLSYGMERYYTLKRSGTSYDYLSNGYNAGYLNNTARPLAGFVGHQAKKHQQESLVFGEERMGRGSIIYLVDNPLFRGFWYSGKQLFSNALFMTNNRSF